MSDIGILVATREPPEIRDKFLLDSVRGVDVEVTVCSLDELEFSLERESHFARNALASGITIYGKRRKKRCDEPS